MSIEENRKRIDALDRQILELINERTHVAKAIGAIKENQVATVYNPTREKEVIEKLISYNYSLDTNLEIKDIKSIFTEIISTCRALEQRPRIAYLGPDGSFSHLAALKQFGSSVDLFAQSSINTTFEVINKAHADYAILPIENSVEGMVNNTLDQLMSHNLFIIAELFIPIELYVFVSTRTLQSVLKLKKSSIEKLSKLSPEQEQQVLRNIKTVYSHPQPFGQSRIWLERYLPDAVLNETNSTSGAATHALGELRSASIGSRQISEVFPGLHMVAEHIEDNTNNTTRFVVLKKIKEERLEQEIPNVKNIITSMMISIKDRPGALYQILAVFARYGVNLTNLVSRPSKRRAFDYAFYLDCEGSLNDPAVKKILKKITPYIVQVKILGCFPRGHRINF